MIVESDGLKWEVTPGDHDEVGPYHEQELTPRVLDLLPAGGVFLDVGAHVGHYTLRAAAKASQVIAVEPNPAAFERLQHNLAINAITNAHCVNVAAWDGTGKFAFHRVHEQYERDGSGRVLPDEHGPIWGARLDDVLSQYPLRPPRLDLAKIDVEGADLHAIGGMRGLIARHRPVLFTEDHSQYGYYRQEDLLALLTGLGYEPEQVTWGPAVYWLARPAPAPSAPPGSS